MSDGFCILYRKMINGFDIESYFNGISSKELEYIKPGSGNSVLSFDVDSVEVYETNINKLGEKLEKNRYVVFYTWYRNKSIFSSIEFITDKIYSEQFALDALDFSEKREVIELNLERFVEYCSDNTGVAFIADASQDADEYDWNEIVLNDFNLMESLPDILGVPGNAKSRILERYGNVNCEVMDNAFIYRR